jgi:hypothetical protein
MQFVRRLNVLPGVLHRVMQIDIVLSKQRVNLHAGFVAQYHANLVFGKAPGAVAFDGKSLKRSARRILARSSKLSRQIIRNGHRHLHTLSITLDVRDTNPTSQRQDVGHPYLWW